MTDRSRPAPAEMMTDAELAWLRQKARQRDILAAGMKLPVRFGRLMTPDERRRLANRLRWRADNAPDLGDEVRNELWRRADNLEAVTRMLRQANRE